jgi:hypothetical protein
MSAQLRKSLAPGARATQADWPCHFLELVMALATAAMSSCILFISIKYAMSFSSDGSGNADRFLLDSYGYDAHVNIYCLSELSPCKLRCFFFAMSASPVLTCWQGGSVSMV